MLRLRHRLVLLVVLQRGGVWDSLGSSEAAAGMGAGAGAESRARGPSSESKPVGPVSITVSSFKKKPSKRAPAAPILPRTRRAATLRSGLSIATTNIRAIQEKAKYRVIFQLRPPLRSSPVFKLRTDKYTGTTATASKNDPSPMRCFSVHTRPSLSIVAIRSAIIKGILCSFHVRALISPQYLLNCQSSGCGGVPEVFLSYSNFFCLCRGGGCLLGHELTDLDDTDALRRPVGENANGEAD